MRVRVLTLSLALVIGGSSLGCKSAPKMSWWKTADTAAPASTTAAAAPGAPQLPSEIAKQADALASTNPVKITTPSTIATTAPAYSAASTPSAYPSTGAKDYLTNSESLKTAAASTSATANAIATVKSGLPYDPMAVPPAATTAVASSPVASAPADRYGMPASQDRYANAYPTTTSAPAYSPANYPTTTASTAPAATQNATLPAVSSSVPFASNPDSASLGDRYATQSVPTASPVSTTVPSYTPVQTASAVASVQPYRPGGTSSYPGTSANYEVATKPTSTGTSTTSGGYPTTSGTQYR